jgi:glycosyltransferase involved in cell wall biosynthesis
MRIAFLSSSLGWGGLERNLHRYATWIKEAGHDIEICAVKDSPLAKAIEQSDLTLRLIQRQHRYIPIKAGLDLKNHLITNRFDALWIRDPRDLPISALATRNTGIDLIFQQGMQIPHRKKAPWHRTRFAAVDHWISPLECLRQEALANTPLIPKQTKVISLALEDHWFTMVKNQEQARKIWKLPVNVKIVGLFGRIDALKGHSDLLRAMAESNAANWHALIIGENTQNAVDGDQLQTLKNLATELDIEDRIHWHPPTEGLKLAYDCCDVYAMCSASETFGMVTIEAMARRIPVIGTNSGGTPELLGYGARGKLYSPGDFKELARSLADPAPWPMPTLDQLEQFSRMKAVQQWQDLLVHSRRSAS